MMSCDPIAPDRGHCCGCTSRSSTIAASCLLFMFALFYLAVCILALTDTSENAPTPPQRIMFILVLVSMALQIIFSLLALWGACTRRGWPVRVAFVWVSICMIFNAVGMIVSMNLFLLIGVLLQFLFFWMPLYGYIQDLSESSTIVPPSSMVEERQMVVYSDNHEGDGDKEEDGMELV